MECKTRRHVPENQDYVVDTAIVMLTAREYPAWDKLKGINGFSSTRVLHDPSAKKKEAPIEEEASELFPVTYLGEDKEMSRDEMKALLDGLKIKYFKGSTSPKIAELIAEITPDE